MMNVVSRVFSRRFLTLGVRQRVAFVSNARLFSSEPDDGGGGKKKAVISSLLSSLKQTDQKVNQNLEEVLQRKKPEQQQESQENTSLEYTNITRSSSDVTDTEVKVTSTDDENISTPLHHSPQKSKPASETLGEMYNAREHPKQPISPEMNEKLKSILSKLRVDTSKSQLSRDIVSAAKSWGRTGPRYRKELEHDFKMQSDPEPTRYSEVISLTSGARFDLFDNIFKSKLPGKEPVPKLMLLEGEEMELLEKHKSIDQRNDFLTWIELADKQWKFPIDNEVYKVEEENVGFEEHVFLGYLLDGFPKKGPVRMFIELVVNGLEQNPYMTVEQKRNQVSWFKQYFDNIPEEDLSF